MPDQPQAAFHAAAMHPVVFHAAAMHPVVFHAAAMHPAVFHAAVMNPAIFHATAMHPAVFHASSMQSEPLAPSRVKELRESAAEHFERVARIFRESAADVKSVEDE